MITKELTYDEIIKLPLFERTNEENKYLKNKLSQKIKEIEEINKEIEKNNKEIEEINKEKDKEIENLKKEINRLKRTK